jgi:hypothetical protein
MVGQTFLSDQTCTKHPLIDSELEFPANCRLTPITVIFPGTEQSQKKGLQKYFLYDRVLT